MTEENRQEVINRIQNEINEKNSLPEKYKDLEEMANNPIIIKYLQLIDEITRIEKDIERYRSPINDELNDSIEERIKHWFRVYRFSCNHKVWLYNGSYYKYTNFKNEEDYMRYNQEDLSNNTYKFSYNKYVCLECREEIKISKSDWEQFENTHLVLKRNDYIDISYYQNLYYQLLYSNYKFSDAKQIIIDEFNKDNKNKVKQLTN